MSDRLYGCLYGRLNACLYGWTNRRGRLLVFRKLDQGPPVVPALVSPAQASRPLPRGFGRYAQPFARLLVSQPFPCDTRTLHSFMLSGLSGLSDRTYGPLYGLQTDSPEPGKARTHDLRRVAMAAVPTRLPLCLALCSTLTGSRESIGRDALRPDAF